MTAAVMFLYVTEDMVGHKLGEFAPPVPSAATAAARPVSKEEKNGRKEIARAEHKYARISPRKVEIICNMIRGKNAKYAMALMENTPKAGCELMIKVLKSAMANAENNFEMDPEKLYVCETHAGAGPILKRGMPRSHGRMYRINKRTSHIMIAVAERPREGGRIMGQKVNPHGLRVGVIKDWDSRWYARESRRSDRRGL